MARTDLDLMEYANDAAAIAAYVPNASGFLADSYPTDNFGANRGLQSGNIIRAAQSFNGVFGKLTSVKFYCAKFGSPTGNAVAKLYAHSGTFGTNGVPTGAALATSGNVDVSTFPTQPTHTLFEFTFTGANQYALVAGTKYFITIEYSGGDASNQVYVGVDDSASTHEGNGAYLIGTTWTTISQDTIFYVYTTGDFQPLSESTIKSEGSYSLKSIAKQTTSLNKTLTKSSLSIDLSNKDYIGIYMRASRTGANIKIGFHNSGNATTDLVPTMTSASSPAGVASTSYEYSSDYAGWKVFDKNAGTLWSGGGGTLPQWVQYQFATAQVVQKYILTGDATVARSPRTFTLSGSNDGTNFTVLDTRLNETGWSAGEKRTYRFANPTAYLYYRINITAVNGDTYTELRAVEFMLSDDIEIFPTINEADTWELKILDLSEVENTDKDDIDSIIVTVANADADNTFYLDCVYSDEFINNLKQYRRTRVPGSITGI